MDDNIKQPDTLLLVDDEDNVLRSISRLFLDENIEILTARSGAEAIELMKSKEVSVIVSDQRMPGMTGAEFLEQAKKISPSTPRIVLTGYADINAAIDAVNKGGAFRYLTKPWSETDLVATVKSAAGIYRTIKENKRLSALNRKQTEELKQWNEKLQMFVQQQTIDLTNQNKELTALNSRLRRNLSDVIGSFSNLIEIRDKGTHSPSSNVRLLSVSIAVKLGIVEAELETISIAAQLHDIGKIGVPDVIIERDPASLSGEELAEYAKHPIRGQVVVSCIEELNDAGRIIRHHHEWIDGGGFPDRLKGEAIPLGARVIAIADGFDRQLQTNSGPGADQKALQGIRQQLGSQFDPELYKHLIEAVRENIAIIAPAQDALEMELLPKDLRAGMRVSRDIRSGTGLLMMSKGTELDEAKIESLRRHRLIDPSANGIFIFT